MEAKFIEQKRVLKLQCYKWVKFSKIDLEKAACPWGYTEINEMCKNCRWFDIEKVKVNGQPVVTDREIGSVEVPRLATNYQDFGKVIDVEGAEQAIAAEEQKENGLH